MDRVEWEDKGGFHLAGKLLTCHPVFPVADMDKTAAYYVRVLGFRSNPSKDAKEPQVWLSRDKVEIILTQTERRVQSIRELYGYGYDAYFVVEDPEALQAAFLCKGAKIARPLQNTDYNCREFVLEDYDGRWIAFGYPEEDA